MSQIVGWKTYAVAAVAIVVGLVAFGHGYVIEGVKLVLGGAALIALRDTLGKLMSLVESNRKCLDNLRAAIDIKYPADRQE
jgi:hypothetical protein